MLWSSQKIRSPKMGLPALNSFVASLMYVRCPFMILQTFPDRIVMQALIQAQYTVYQFSFTWYSIQLVVKFSF